MDEQDLLTIHLERDLREELQSILVELFPGPFDYNTGPLIENGRVKAPTSCRIMVPKDKVSRHRTDRGKNFQRLGAVTHHIPETHQGVGPLFRDVLQHCLPCLSIGMNV